MKKQRSIDNRSFEDLRDEEYKRKSSERYGCDYCKEDRPTERFEGCCGDVLWICGRCYAKLIIKPQKSTTPKTAGHNIRALCLRRFS